MCHYQYRGRFIGEIAINMELNVKISLNKIELLSKSLILVNMIKDGGISDMCDSTQKHRKQYKDSLYVPTQKSNSTQRQIKQSSLSNDKNNVVFN